MTATFSDATANAMLAVLAAAGVYVSLHSANPGKTGANELSGSGYARKAITLASVVAQEISNNAVITFGPASADWVEAQYFGLWSASTAGVFKAGAILNAPVTVHNLTSAAFALNALILSLKTPIV